jgi:hypothetical protein
VFQNRKFYKNHDARAWLCGSEDSAADLVANLRGLGESYHDYTHNGGLAGTYPDDRPDVERKLRSRIEEISKALTDGPSVSVNLLDLMPLLGPGHHSAEEVQWAMALLRPEAEKRRAAEVGPYREHQQALLEQAQRALLAFQENHENEDVFEALRANLNRLGWRVETDCDRRLIHPAMGGAGSASASEGQGVGTAPRSCRGSLDRDAALPAELRPVGACGVEKAVSRRACGREVGAGVAVVSTRPDRACHRAGISCANRTILAVGIGSLFSRRRSVRFPVPVDRTAPDRRVSGLRISVRNGSKAAIARHRLSIARSSHRARIVSQRSCVRRLFLSQIMCVGNQPLLRVCHISIARRYTYGPRPAVMHRQRLRVRLTDRGLTLSHCASATPFRRS